MRPDALGPYEHALLVGAPLALQTAEGRTVQLDVDRWLAPVDVGDETVLQRCTGPVLDVGCGPGRFASSLTQRGIAALGVDIADAAVTVARLRGTMALKRNIFDRLPGEGRWPTALLMDGNIGIGGDPGRLLRRLARVMAVRGQLLVEAHTDDTADEVLTVRFNQHGICVGPEFDWAHVGLHALLQHAHAAGYRHYDTWEAGGRTFAALSVSGGGRIPHRRRIRAHATYGEE